MVDWESEEAIEAWLQNIKRYFEVYRYDDNLRERLVILKLSEKAGLWWQEDRRVNNIRSKGLSWKVFKKLFKNKYMSERYYD